MEWSVFKAVEDSVLAVVSQYGSNYWNDLQAARRRIGDSYSDQGLGTHNASTLPFSSEAMRWAYAHLYVTAHTHIVKDILGRFWMNNRNCRIWLNRVVEQQVRVCCIGGGPGTDILGFVLFITHHGLNMPVIRGDVLDQWTEWQDTFALLLENLDPYNVLLPSGGMGVEFRDFHFHQNWERSTHSWNNLQRLRQANLVTMVKFVSAVAADKEECEDKLAIILQLMKDGAVLFFLDNAGGGYSRIVQQAADTAGLKQIGKIEHVDMSLPDHEGEYISNSKLRLTKIKTEKTWKVSAFLWVKSKDQGFSKREGKRLKKQSTQNLNFPKHGKANCNLLPPVTSYSSSIYADNTFITPGSQISKLGNVQHTRTSQTHGMPQHVTLASVHGPAGISRAEQPPRPKLTPAASNIHSSQSATQQRATSYAQVAASQSFIRPQSLTGASSVIRPSTHVQIPQPTFRQQTNTPTQPGINRNLANSSTRLTSPMANNSHLISGMQQKFAATTSYQNYGAVPGTVPRNTSVYGNQPNTAQLKNRSKNNMDSDKQTPACCGLILSCFGW